jgi:nucleoside-diphosphate-sugar epimerase
VTIHAGSVTGPHRTTRDHEATLAMIDGARAAEAPRLVVYTSGLWTLGATTDADEDTTEYEPAEVSRYRVELERAVVGAGGGSLVTAVTRPGMVYGGREGSIAWLERWLPEDAGRPQDIVTVGDGSNRWSPVHIEDLAELYTALVAQRRFGIFHAMEQEPVVVNVLARELARISGRSVFGWALADARAKLGPMADALALDAVVHARRSDRVLGWRPRRPPILSALAGAYAESHGLSSPHGMT